MTRAVLSCYFLSVCAGSCVDQHSNNVSLFNLVEQINVPSGASLPPNGVVPLEMHAYWQTDALGAAVDFEMRFVMVAGSGLETASTPQLHRGVRGRFRTRVFGLPYPPVTGAYTLRVDWRHPDEHQFKREGVSWPILLQESERTPRVTH